MVKTRSGAGKRESLEAPKIIERSLTPEDDFSDDDDAPMEITSKKTADITLTEPEPEEKSLFEQIQDQKREEEEHKKQKKVKKVKRKKLGEGNFAVKVKKTEFKVVALDKGTNAPLEPARNYRAELLAARTSNRRVKGPGSQLQHRAKWTKKH